MNLADRKNGKGWALAGFAVLFAVYLPLLFRTMGSGPHNDWTNHCWMANYFARYFLAHLAFPHTLNTDQLVGLAYPVFYASLFYPVVGMFSTIFDANVTLRLFAMVALAAQLVFVYRTAWALLKDRLFAFTIATVVTWAIYPLTNLYHRAAMPEFFACIFLTGATTAWIRAITAESQQRLFLWCNLAVLCLCAAAGTHPITAVYGIVAFALQIILGLIARPTFSVKKILLALVIPSALAAVCLAPWMITAKRYSHEFQVADGFNKVGYFMLSIDGPVQRLSPIPLPTSVLADGIARDRVKTEHLDAQVSIPLALLFIASAFALYRRKGLNWRAAAIILTVGFLVAWMVHISTTFGSMSRLGYVFRCIQFAYRIVSYINLLLLAGVFFCVALLKNVKDEEQDETPQMGKGFLPRGVLVAVLTLSTIAVVMKISFAFEMQPIEPHFFSNQRLDAELLQLPTSFYGYQTYAMPRSLGELNKSDASAAGSIVLKPLDGRRFGEVASVPLPVAGQNWIKTNVQEFAWNKLYLNGKQIGTGELGASDMLIAVKNSPAGVLSYSFKPAATWAQLNVIALPLFLLWIVATLAAFVRLRWQEAKREKETCAKTESGLSVSTALTNAAVE
ncbi:MAG TPA: hypothetical protein V6C81_29860 [Planktothrix sp.]|jgi:hypothetical protein